MAKIALTASVPSTGDTNGQYAVVPGQVSDPVAAISAGKPSTAALDAAMATLVADGASPTQAHVTAANSALTAFETALTAYYTASAANFGANVTLLIDSTAVTKINQLKSAVAALLRQAASATSLTP